MLTEPTNTPKIHSALRAPRQRTIRMIIPIYMLLPAIERHVVLITIIPATAAAAGGAGTGDDVDGTSRGVVDGDIGGGLAIEVDGAGVVEELLGAVATALKLPGELVEGDHFCG